MHSFYLIILLYGLIYCWDFLLFKGKSSGGTFLSDEQLDHEPDQSILHAHNIFPTEISFNINHCSLSVLQMAIFKGASDRNLVPILFPHLSHKSSSLYPQEHSNSPVTSTTTIFSSALCL
jgi:hypothetical protein